VPGTDVPFTEPWHARVFAAAVVACERLGLPWDAFRDRLKAAVAEDPDRPYFDSFTLALVRLTTPASRADRSPDPASLVPGSAETAAEVAARAEAVTGPPRTQRH
jgi:hypothetical protein